MKNDLQYQQLRKWGPSGHGSYVWRDRQSAQLQAADVRPQVQEALEYFFRKWFWTSGQWGRRTHKNPTNSIKFIRKKYVPIARSKDVTYVSFFCNVHNEKAEKNRTRFVVGGDQINYLGKVATPTADILVAKLLFNSVISTRNSNFMTMDISNFYLVTPLKRPEYIRISIKDIPDKIINEYKLGYKADKNGSVYIEANRGMYRLPQAGLLANELLEKRLNKRGYR